MLCSQGLPSRAHGFAALRTPRGADRATAVTIDVIGFGIVMPVLPALITHLGHVDLAAATRIAGWMLALFAVTQFFAGPVLGNLGDRFGRRPVLMAAMLAFAIDYSLMAGAPTIAWLFLGRAIAGIAGASFGPASAVIADVTPPEKRAATFGMLGAAFGIGFIIGPALGGLVAGFRATRAVHRSPRARRHQRGRDDVPAAGDAGGENRRPFRLRDAHIVGAFKPLFDAGNATPLLVAWFLWQLAASSIRPPGRSGPSSLRLGRARDRAQPGLGRASSASSSRPFAHRARRSSAIGERARASSALAAGAATLIASRSSRPAGRSMRCSSSGASAQMAWPALNGLLSRMVDKTRQGALAGRHRQHELGRGRSSAR